MSIVIAIWLIFIAGLAWWNIAQEKLFHLQVNLETARSFYNLIITTREWNARSGGVYVPISDEVQPNPYLDIPNRDITTMNGANLTTVNPAYMTRMISELAESEEGVNFRLVSLNPIRPQNMAEDWERQALTQFEEHKQGEYYFLDNSTKIFYYMAPLITHESCIKCHGKQGYKVGDIRGGLVVSLPTQSEDLWTIILSHITIAGIGAVSILVFGRKLISTYILLEQQTEIDGLTQINNRRYFDNQYTREFLRSKRLQSPLSVLLCDIDFFKAYNDHYGHQAGDECLKEVAQALKQVLKRPGDLVARYGGEEFVIILGDSSWKAARTVADMLRAQIEALQIPHDKSSICEFVTISIGYSIYTGHEISKTELLEQADKALYQAKKMGRNISVAYED